MLSFHQVRHGYDLPAGGRREVLRKLDLKLASGEFHVILGRSGCGKSTLLRLLAGLETPEHGALEGDRSAIGVVFQEPRLMPWLTVAQNAGFLLAHRLDRSETRRRVASALAMVGLADAADLRPDKLSGGMAQRVAIARALVSRPKLLLMDEPFGALDAFTRKQMQDELIRIWQTTGTTIVFVTHDIEEAIRLGRTILVLEEGQVALDLKLAAAYPRPVSGAEIESARQQLFSRFFPAPRIPAPAGPRSGELHDPTD
ncbi:MAG: putative aliphatic sulfonates import ATP-binding protein SsuB [Devosia sp.]|nr:putative aliphatic sulfonates import ATP-binding protein SsuB [Devosia sp.]